MQKTSVQPVTNAAKVNSSTKTDQKTDAESQEAKKSTNTAKDSIAKIVAMGIATVTAGAVALYKFVLTGRAE